MKSMNNLLETGLAVWLSLGLALAGSSQAAAEGSGAARTNAADKAALPRLVDLGAGKCVQCKMMAPVLTELRKEYDGRMTVEFVDVWKDPEAGKAYKIEIIPTQIFFDPAGKERYRHEGFLSKKDILAKWQELGIELKPGSGTPKPEVQSPKSQGK
jgi:thioredoxin 1